jgi:anhydro-N-acetylmuramic acid kinase
LAWLKQKLLAFSTLSAEDIQATLAELTAISVSNAIQQAQPECDELFVCGGGAHNRLLLKRLENHLGETRVTTTDALGVSPDWVEAMAFAWLAHCFITRIPGNCPDVTAAKGPRILGALYPA